MHNFGAVNFEYEKHGYDTTIRKEENISTNLMLPSRVKSTFECQKILNIEFS